MRRLETTPELIAFLGDAARDVPNRLCDRLAAPAKRLCGLIERLELRAHAAHCFEERSLELVDMQCRRELIREAANHRDVLHAIRGALVMLQLEQSDVAVAEAHW